MKNLYFSLFLFSVLISACSDDSIITRTFDADDYPIEDGYYWQYLKIDNDTEERDTIDCYATAFDTIIHNRDSTSFRLDYSQNGIYLFSEFVKINSEELIIYKKLSISFTAKIKHVKFPISKNKENKNFRFGKTSYSNTYRYTDQLHISHRQDINDTMDFAKDIGLVHRTFEFLHAQTSEYETWILIDCDFNP